MKAITLYQPHAYLVGIGAKKFETRPRRTHIRGLIAIHAAQIQRGELDDLVLDRNARTPKFIPNYDRYLPAQWSDYFGAMQHGGIECLAVLEDCRRATLIYDQVLQASLDSKSQTQRKAIAETLAFGDFTRGRFAYKLRTVFHVGGSVGGIVRGHQGWWNLPRQVENDILKAALPVVGMICRVCGCTEDRACQTPSGPCSWTKLFLCSACAQV